MNPVALINTSLGNLKVELYVDKMPQTAGNILKLMKSGFYDGLHFHKVISGFIVALGNPMSKDPKKDLVDQESPLGPCPLECPEDQKLSNVPGTLAMCNNGEENQHTGGSEFFINCVHNAYLDWFSPGPIKHPVFGRVIEGMDILHKIEKVKVDAADKPNEEFVKVHKITVFEMT